MGKRFVETERKDVKEWKFSIYEIVATFFTVMVFIWMKQDFSNPILLATKNWTTFYIPLAAMWVILFIERKGIISRLLTNKVTIFVGNISAYTFLIHYVITQYLNSVIAFLYPDLSNWNNVLKITIEFFLTIIVTVIYLKIARINLK